MRCTHGHPAAQIGFLERVLDAHQSRRANLRGHDLPYSRLRRDSSRSSHSPGNAPSPAGGRSALERCS
jgi:hypothetical protein